MKITPKIINEIAQQLDSNMICYVNKQTGEFLFVPNPDGPYYDASMDAWDDDIKKIEENRAAYTVVDPMWSSQSFKIMEYFAHDVEDKKVRDRLFNALEKRKPFRRFRDVLDQHDSLLEEWYKFKQLALEKHVKKELSIFDRYEEE